MARIHERCAESCCDGVREMTITHEQMKKWLREHLAMMGKIVPPDNESIVYHAALLAELTKQSGNGKMKSDYPSGAVVNGQTCIERIESFYKFSEEHGYTLAMCADWQNLKQCFNYLADTFPDTDALNAKQDDMLIPELPEGWYVISLFQLLGEEYVWRCNLGERTTYGIASGDGTTPREAVLAAIARIGETK